MRFTSPLGTYDIDDTNLAHAIRLLGHRTARAEGTTELLHELRPVDDAVITSYMTRTDRVLLGLVEASKDITRWFDGEVLESYLEGFNSAVSSAFNFSEDE